IVHEWVEVAVVKDPCLGCDRFERDFGTVPSKLILYELHHRYRFFPHSEFSSQRRADPCDTNDCFQRHKSSAKHNFLLLETRNAHDPAVILLAMSSLPAEFGRHMAGRLLLLEPT